MSPRAAATAKTGKAAIPARSQAAWDRENEPAVLHADLDAAIERHPAGSRIPPHLTGSDRRGGGDPMADYRYLKGEL